MSNLLDVKQVVVHIKQMSISNSNNCNFIIIYDFNISIEIQ